MPLEAQLPTRDELLDEPATFWWDYQYMFFVETNFGSWLWSDPAYGGSNTLVKFSGSIKDFCDRYWEGFAPVRLGSGLLAEKANPLTLIVYPGGRDESQRSNHP